jgi:hypothetical protein
MMFGFEVGDASEMNGNSGTFSVQSTTKRTGGWALKVNPTTTNTGYGEFSGRSAAGSSGATAYTTSYTRFYFRAAAFPTTSEEIVEYQTIGNVLIAALRVIANGAGGNLQLFDDTGTAQIGSTGSTLLAVNTWYRIEIVLTNTVPQTVTVKLDGATEITATDVDLGSVGMARVRFGKVLNRNGNSVEFYYDDIYVDDATWPGAGQILAMRPNGDGNYTAWTIGVGGGSDWENVDDPAGGGSAAHDGDATYLKSTGLDEQETVDLESTATVGISGTIHAVVGIVYVREQPSGGSQHFLVMRSNTTDALTNVLNLTTTYNDIGLYKTTDPATGTAWTTAGLDAVEIGCYQGGTQELRWTAGYLMVDFEPAAAPVVVPNPLRGRIHRVPAFHK